MKIQSFNIALAALLLLVFSACQKDIELQAETQNLETPDLETPSATDRNPPLYYGVTQYMAGYHSQLMRFFPSGDMQSNVFVQGQDNNGVWYNMGDMEGICEVYGMGAANGYYITTGTSATNVYFQRKLLKIDPTVSSAMVLGPPVLSTGTAVMRDICFIGPGYTGITQGIYGIVGGMLKRINISGTTFSGPVNIGTMTGLAAGYVTKGLSWTRGCGGAPELIVSATNTTLTPAKIYKCNPNTGALTFVGDVNPTAPEIFRGANAGIGWFSGASELWMNGKYNSTAVAPIYRYGQAKIAPWFNTCSLPQPAKTATNLGPTYTSYRNIDDFCTIW